MNTFKRIDVASGGLYQLQMPASEAMMHCKLVDRRLWVHFTETWLGQGENARAYHRVSVFSENGGRDLGTFLPSEVGIYQDEHGYYFYKENQ